MSMTGSRPLFFAATLTGSQEVPPVATVARGAARFTFDPAFTRLQVTLFDSGLRNVTEAHIHFGRPGEAGPIVLYLFRAANPWNPGPATATFTGVYTAANLTGPALGMTLTDFARIMATGNTYVNVHTVQHPTGENRGQILPLLR
jgi:hypothetical protein